MPCNVEVIRCHFRKEGYGGCGKQTSAAGRISNDSSNTQRLEVQKKGDNERAVHKIGT